MMRVREAYVVGFQFSFLLVFCLHSVESSVYSEMQIVRCLMSCTLL